jgi:hypothetical protein
MRLLFALCSCLILAGCSKPQNSGTTKEGSAYPVSATLLVNTISPQMFTAVFHDPAGGSHIKEVTFSVMTDKTVPGGISRWSAHECLVRYDIATNAIWLVPDVGGTWGSHSIIAGSSTTFSNSQCTVMATGSSAQVSGDSVTINLELEFTPVFSGTKRIYLGCADVNDKWSDNYQKQFGEFTIRATQP